MPANEDRQAVHLELIQKAQPAEDRPELMFDPERSPWGPGDRAWAACVLASRDKLPSTVQEFADGAVAGDLPRFPSTLEPIDRIYGGFFGVTSLIADPGIGKTMLAWACALTTAATQKFNVVYFNGELDEGELIERRAREMTVHETAIDGAAYLKVVQVGLGQTPMDFCVELCSLDPELPLLAVIDSINTIASLSPASNCSTMLTPGSAPGTASTAANGSAARRCGLVKTRKRVLGFLSTALNSSRLTPCIHPSLRRPTQRYSSSESSMSTGSVGNWRSVICPKSLVVIS